MKEDNKNTTHPQTDNKNSKPAEDQKKEKHDHIDHSKEKICLHDMELYMNKGDYQVHVLIEEVRELKGQDLE
jgi:hypothetical protein